MGAVDPEAFRLVAGRFATGVTVVTAYADGRHHGMTANSFTSVSLDPVLVLVSVERVARFHDAVMAAGGFVVNVLAHDQEHLSRFFATRGRPHDPTELAELSYTVSPVAGAVCFGDALATIECTTWAVYDGGDHSLVVGEVVGTDLPRTGAGPLVFYAGSYRSLDPPPPG